MIWILLLSALSLFAAEQIEDQSGITPLAPRLKAREIYKGVLENGLKLYLISDPYAEESAAAVSVGTGSWRDPKEFPGLAHYVEHMLFMGTKSHPDEFSFTQFLKENSGDSNAFTEDLYTTYLFHVGNSGFPEALSRFSEFFREPLLKASGMSREIRAITQEFQGSLNRDSARRIMVYKALGNSDHPFSRFNFGNAATLGSATPDDLRSWMEHQYSTDRMLLVVISPLPLKELVRIAEEDFGSLQKKEVEKSPFPTELFSKEAKGAIVYTKPIQEITSLILSWELEDPLSFSKEAKPDALLCYVLGHEGKGSLLQLLKEEGLALELDCGMQRWSDSEQLFLLEIDLTEKGAKNPYLVLSRVFQAIDFLKSRPFPKSLYEEVEALAKVEALFPDQQKPFDELYTHAKGLRTEELASYPRKSRLIEQFQPETVQHLLSELTPENALINLMSQEEIAYDREEPWMHVPFKLSALDIAKIEKGESKVAYPEPNLYIPTKLEKIAPKEESSVALLFQSNQIELWGREGNRFETAEVYWSLLFNSPVLAFTENRNAALVELWIQLFERLFAEKAYAATLSGIKTSFSANELGLKLTLSGFREHALLFLENLLTFAKDLNPSEEIFEREKEELLKQLQSKKSDSPYKQAFELLKETLVIPFVTSDEKIEALLPLSLSDFKSFQKELFSILSVKALSIGDQTMREQETLFSLLEKTLKGEAPKNPLERKVVILPKERGPFLLQQNSDSLGSALLLAIEDPDSSFEHHASGLLLARLIEDPFFQTLRTEQQTAYLIDSSMESIDQVLLSLFVLESHSYDPRDLLARVELFLEQFDPTEEAFQTTKLSLVSELSQQPLSLTEEGKRLGDLLYLRNGDFSFRSKLKEAMESLTFPTFKQISNSLLSAENRRRLAILIHGTQNESRGPLYETINSPSELHKQ